MSALRPALLATLATSRLLAQQTPGEVSPDALFAGALPRIDLRLEPAALKALEKDPREWVDFVLAEQSGATLKDCHARMVREFEGVLDGWTTTEIAALTAGLERLREDFSR